MDFKEYQLKSRETAVYPNKGDNLPYLALGINGEAGEVSEKVKKFIRDTQFAGVGDLDKEQKHALILEVGDVLWYIAQLATEVGYDLEEVAELNISKTHSRFHRDKISGDGDDR